MKKHDEEMMDVGTQTDLMFYNEQTFAEQKKEALDLVAQASEKIKNVDKSLNILCIEVE